MTIELYAAPKASQSEQIESPVSNIRGELPDQEPALELGEPIGTFDNREEAIEFIKQQMVSQNQVVSDTKTAPFNDYTHIEWLTVTVKTADQSTQDESYYLVTDEGY